MEHGFCILLKLVPKKTTKTAHLIKDPWTYFDLERICYELTAIQINIKIKDSKEVRHPLGSDACLKKNNALSCLARVGPAQVSFGSSPCSFTWSLKGGEMLWSTNFGIQFIISFNRKKKHKWRFFLSWIYQIWHFTFSYIYKCIVGHIRLSFLEFKYELSWECFQLQFTRVN